MTKEGIAVERGGGGGGGGDALANLDASDDSKNMRIAELSGSPPRTATVS